MTKRRQFLRYLGVGALTAATAAIWEGQIKAQTVSIDLKALFLGRIDELIKLAEKPPVPEGVEIAIPTESLKEAKKAFEAGKLEDVGKQLNAFSTILHVLRLAAPPGLPFSMPFISEVLRASLYKVIDAFVLFSERVGKKEAKIHVGLYVCEKEKKEEIFGPFLIKCPKELKLTIGGKLHTFKLKECRSV